MIFSPNGTRGVSINNKVVEGAPLNEARGKIVSTLINRRRNISFVLFEVTGKEGDDLAYTWKHVGQNLVNISPEHSADEPKQNVNSKPKDSSSCHPKDSSRIIIIV